MDKNTLKSYSSSGGTSFFSLLFLLFLGLKLAGIIDWSWWWIFSPILIPIAFILFLLFIIGILSLLVVFSEKRKGKS